MLSITTYWKRSGQLHDGWPVAIYHAIKLHVLPNRIILGTLSGTSWNCITAFSLSNAYPPTVYSQSFWERYSIYEEPLVPWENYLTSEAYNRLRVWGCLVSLFIGMTMASLPQYWSWNIQSFSERIYYLSHSLGNACHNITHGCKCSVNRESFGICCLWICLTAAWRLV